MDSLINIAVGSGIQTFVNLTADLPANERSGATLARIILDLGLNAVTAGSGTVMDLAVHLMENDALAAGAGPDPDVGTERPGWIWRTRRGVFTSLANDRAQEVRLVYDSKAGRKMAGEAINIVLNVINQVGGASTVNIDGIVRLLFLKS